MSSARKSGGGEGGEMDIDLGEGKVINLESEQGGAAGGEGSAVGLTTTKKLEQSFQDLVLEGDETKRMELISKLEASRAQTAEEERRARRAAWTEETRKVILERQLFQESGTTDLFPELVWEPILKKLEDPKDKARLSRMSPLWRRLLKKERTTFLFHEVFPVVHAKAYIPRDEILNCRATSQEWKLSTENWIQNFFHCKPISFLQKRKAKPAVGIDLMVIRFQVDWTEVVKVEAFAEWSQSYPNPTGNPFPFRTPRFGCICPHDGQSNHRFWNGVEALLTQYGKEVWTLMIQFSRINYFDSAGAYDMICKLLKLTPNLRELDIKSPNPMVDTDLLKKRLKNNPLPEMPMLRNLVMAHIPPIMMKAMLTKFAPTVDIVFAPGLSGTAFVGSSLPALKQFSNQSPALTSEVSKFNADWPAVEEIDLHYENTMATEIPNLFRSLSDVGRTLRKLMLTLDNEEATPSKLNAAGLKMLSLELPHLEELSLTMGMSQGNLKCIDFILPMTALKILTLTYVKRTPLLKDKKEKEKRRGRKPGPSKQGSDSTVADPAPGGGAIIQFWEYINRLYESNIWKLFPDLRKVTIITIVVHMFPPVVMSNMEGIVNRDEFKEKSYSREGYRQFTMEP